MHSKNADVFVARVYPTLNSSVLQCFERSNTAEIRNGIMFNFYKPKTATYEFPIRLQKLAGAWSFSPDSFTMTSLVFSEVSVVEG